MPYSPILAHTCPSFAYVFFYPMSILLSFDYPCPFLMFKIQLIHVQSSDRELLSAFKIYFHDCLRSFNHLFFIWLNDVPIFDIDWCLKYSFFAFQNSLSTIQLLVPTLSFDIPHHSPRSTCPFHLLNFTLSSSLSKIYIFIFHLSHISCIHISMLLVFYIRYCYSCYKFCYRICYFFMLLCYKFHCIPLWAPFFSTLITSLRWINIL